MRLIPFQPGDNLDVRLHARPDGIAHVGNAARAVGVRVNVKPALAAMSRHESGEVRL